MIKFLTFLLLIHHLNASEITSCKISPSGKAEMSFAQSYTVKNIVMKDGKIVMPVEQHKERVYENIRIISKQTYERILSIFKTGKCVSAKKKTPVNFKVRSVRKLKSEYRIANAEVEFDEDIMAVFGIMRNRKGNLSVSVPADFIFIDESFKQLVFKDIISRAPSKNFGKDK